MDPAKKKKLIQTIIVIGLLPVLGWSMMNNLGLLKEQGGETIAPVIAQIEEAAAPVTDSIKALQGRTMGDFAFMEQEMKKASEPDPHRARYTAGDMRDPFLAQFPKVETDGRGRTFVNDSIEGGFQTTFEGPDGTMISLPELNIQGLLWGGRTPQAIIDDVLYAVGDIVHGGKILAIEKTGITMEYQGVTMSIPMPRELY